MLLGHSFVRRLDKYMQEQGKPNLSLDRAGLELRLKGWSGMTMANFPKALKQVSTHRPELVILDIGTNDIDAQRMSLEVLVDQLFKFGTLMVSNYGVKRVVFLEVLPRGRGRHAAKNPQFTAQVQQFNADLMALVTSQQGVYRRLHCWNHRRMRTNVHRYLRDGVHLNDQGMKKYFHSVKGAVVSHARCCQVTS